MSRCCNNNCRQRCCCLPKSACNTNTPLAGNAFVQTNLVSNVPGLALHTDPNAVNLWGLTRSAGSPYWSVSNGQGVAVLYNGSGTPFPPPPATPLVVTIPGGSPTGAQFNIFGATNPTAFMVRSADGTRSAPAAFLFDSESGIISGWAPSVDRTNAIVAVDRSASGAVYKSISISNSPSFGPVLYAANFHAGVVEMYDAQFNLVRTFTDPRLLCKCLRACPTSTTTGCFAPFGLAVINNTPVVTFALQNAEVHDDVSGAGNGYVSLFDLDGNFIRRLISRGCLNSPWAATLAPATGFGPLSGALLIGNFGDGLIHAYDFTTGQLLDVLRGVNGLPLAIDGLWALLPGGGFPNNGLVSSLYFSAGQNNEVNGLFGMLNLA